jgi:hypothetical protein
MTGKIEGPEYVAILLLLLYVLYSSCYSVWNTVEVDEDARKVVSYLELFGKRIPLRSMKFESVQTIELELEDEVDDEGYHKLNPYTLTLIGGRKELMVRSFGNLNRAKYYARRIGEIINCSAIKIVDNRRESDSNWYVNWWLVFWIICCLVFIWIMRAWSA